MRIALTGASGFVGRHVLGALVGHGDEVVAVSRRVPDYLPPGVRHEPFDLRTADGSTYARLGKPDTLVHLAWEGLPNYRSRHHYEDELPRQYHFLRLMVEAGLPAMTVAGTCYEYGMVDGALDETLAPQPANPYAFAKLALLRQLEFLQADHSFALTWARMFYMWGEGQASGSLWPLLRAAAERGDATFPMSAGEQLRDYMPIQEVGATLARLARVCADAGVVNVCSGVPVSIRVMVEHWIAQAGWKIAPELGRYPYPSYEPLAFWGTTAKREAVLAVAEDSQQQL